MNDTIIYQNNVTEELQKTFNLYLPKLQQKYNIRFGIQLYYDTLLIEGKYKELVPLINNIRRDIIEFAKNTLDEEYIVVLPEPAMTTDSFGNVTANSIVVYSLKRIIKDKEVTA